MRQQVAADEPRRLQISLKIDAQIAASIKIERHAGDAPASESSPADKTRAAAIRGVATTRRYWAHK